MLSPAVVWIAPSVVDDFAVVDAILGPIGKNEFAESQLRKALDPYLESSHRFTVAVNDNAFVGAFTMQGIEYAVDAQAERHE